MLHLQHLRLLGVEGVDVSARKRWPPPALCRHNDGVPYVSRSVEVAALDVLHRCGWQPVSQDMVTAWFDDRSRHAGVCPCWRCRAARKSTPDRVFECLQAWRRTAAATTGTGVLSPVAK